MSHQAVSRPVITIVVAMTRDRIIGHDGGMPWRLPADLARFRALTMGKPIIMGRCTHESIGRVLDGRRNIVLSRRSGFRAPGCVVAHSLEEALHVAATAVTDAAFTATSDNPSGEAFGAAFDTAPGTTEVAVIGGANVYEQTLPFASRMYLTLVHASIDGDTRFPATAPRAWREVSREERRADAGNRCDLTFIELERLPPEPACAPRNGEDERRRVREAMSG